MKSRRLLQTGLIALFLGLSMVSTAADDQPKRSYHFYYNQDVHLQELIQQTEGLEGQKKVIVYKSKHLMEVYVGNTLLKKYEVSI